MKLTSSDHVHVDDFPDVYIDDAQKTIILLLAPPFVEHLYHDDTFFGDSSVVRFEVSSISNHGATLVIRTGRMSRTNTGQESSLSQQ